LTARNLAGIDPLVTKSRAYRSESRGGSIGRSAAAAISLLAVALITGSAGIAAPRDADFELGLLVDTTLSAGTITPVPNGGTVTVSRRTFVVGARIRLEPAQSERAHLRVELANGLTWGVENPATTLHCSGTATTADCETMPSRPGPHGPTDEIFGWDVTATQNGRYVVRARLTDPSAPDPVLSNNETTVTVIVREQSATVFAAPARLIPERPRAGRSVRATVSILTSAGSRPRPTALMCTGKVGTKALSGTPSASAGQATCLYRPPVAARGKTLSGSVAFTVAGTRFSKSFRAKLT
jgi:hypothetical protein